MKNRCKRQKDYKKLKKKGKKLIIVFFKYDYIITLFYKREELMEE